MPRCPECGLEVDESREACPSCDTPVPWNTDVTRLADLPPEGRRHGSSSPPKGGSHGSSSAPKGGSRVTSSSGWATTSDAISHGRFAPGTLLDGRYRIVGRLGRGGMGEVYRADDLKLGQPVALKFLSDALDADPARLTQLHAEVRIARQVSHPNVCRVYDADEFEGHTFLSMEYVDGEDLSSLLRRIGRFPQDRALELARQICAGLAAAHDRGVVHRDLKPANIMLDGSGRIRITDFGLAGASGETLRAGTPAYMAPEQLAGQEVTPRSDIYALGLVLYELFTGQRALDAANVAELIAKREQGDITPPTTIVRDLDPSVERVIFRCLDPTPARRPPSALAVAAALPGGDPLAAALAAGETPSPEMVAAAGTTAALATRTIVAAVAWIVLSLVALPLAYQRVELVNRAPLVKTPDALVDRAQEIVAKLGYGDGIRGTAAGLSISLDWERFLAATTSGPRRWDALRTPRPETFVLWYRTSPRVLFPVGLENRVDGLNPPLTVSGMTLALLDPAGHLSEFVAVPEPVRSAATHPPMNWSVLFEAAGLPLAAFKPVTPEWNPTVYADERAAWEGALPEQPDHIVRVEAAAYGGRAVFFGITGPWTRSSRTPVTSAPSTFNAVIGTLSTLIMPGLMLAGALLARRNVKLGRGDRRGAFRAAAALFLMLMTAWALGDRHVASLGGEIDKCFSAIGQALFGATVLWLTYLGLEPYVRRFSPESLIGWTRLLAGNWRDPRVGRDVLIGVAAGLLMTGFWAAHNLLPSLAGRPEPMPIAGDPSQLMTLRYTFSALFDRAQNALLSAMLGVAGYATLYILLKRWWAAALAAMVVYTPVAVNGMFMPGNPLLDLAIGGAIIVVWVWVIARVGLLASFAALLTHMILLRAPLTTDFSSWRGPAAMVYLAVVAALGFGSCYIAAGRMQPHGPPRTA